MSDYESKLKILAIDDEPSIRELITVVLEDQYNVLTASSGIEGIRIAKAERPDLILLDILMPGHDGIACLQELRASVETSRLPILMLTALNDVSTRVKAFNAGADDFIPKPFRPDELIARINAKLTRLQELAKVTPLVLKFGNLVLDLMAARAQFGHEETYVDPVEFRILSLLMRRRGAAMTGVQLRESIFAVDPQANEVFANRIESIREKLKATNVALTLTPAGSYLLEIKGRATR